MKYGEREFFLQLTKLIDLIDKFDFNLYGKTQTELQKYLYEVKFDLHDTLKANGYDYTYKTASGSGSNKIRLIKIK